MQEEIRRSTMDGASSSKHDDEENLALASKAKKGKGKASQYKSSEGGKKFNKSKVRCFHCHELGHYATNCPKKKSKKGSSKESDGDKNIFSTLEEKDLQIWIEMGDDRKNHVSGEGTVLFQRENGSPFILSNVMYVPRLKNNLVSIAMLEDKGYDVVFSLGKVEDCAILSSKAEVVHDQDIGELWHRRLSHLHHGALKIMQQISTGFPRCTLEQTSTCKGCTLGKYAKYSFHDRDSRAGAVLELIHSNVCGPFSTASTTKHRYYVIFVDDFSRRSWIYFMQRKDQTFLKFCEFKTLVEKESGMKIKALRADNNGEYVSQ
eukprot:PITA_15151